MERAMDQLAGSDYTSRIEIKAGRFAATDDFDVNRYANNTRTQFLNLGFINNTAWDFAADTRGYSNGCLLRWSSLNGNWLWDTFRCRPLPMAMIETATLSKQAAIIWS